MLDTALFNAPDVTRHASVAFRMPRIRLYLVGGCAPSTDPDSWLFVASDDHATSNLRGAELFAFSLAGYRAAVATARSLLQGPLCGSRLFTARVLVTGDSSNPEEIIEAWRLESDRPVRLARYSFQ